MTVLGFHTAPTGRKILGRTLPQGFTLGYFRFFPHLELLTVFQDTVQKEPFFRSNYDV
jgi:hypothetical protein